MHMSKKCHFTVSFDIFDTNNYITRFVNWEGLRDDLAYDISESWRGCHLSVARNN